MPRARDLDAVTVDAFGTLVELADPVERLRDALAGRGVARDGGHVRRAFAAEVGHYVPRAHLARDAATLAALRRECMVVVLGALGARLDPGEFVPAFVAALEFRPIEGAVDALDRLRGEGLVLACVANWDYTLPDQLAATGLAGRFAAVVSAAEAGAPKPEPAIFRLALGRLGIPPERALHVGDDKVDRLGAEAAGLAFEPAPLATLPQRLGLDTR